MSTPKRLPKEFKFVPRWNAEHKEWDYEIHSREEGAGYWNIVAIYPEALVEKEVNRLRGCGKNVIVEEKPKKKAA